MPAIIQSERFTGSVPMNRDFEDATVIDCRFENYAIEGAVMNGAVFVGCSFKKVDFYWASLFRARFVRCDLEEVSLRGASMMEAAFVGCRLVRCDFSHDNLGADTDLTGVVFHECERIECDYTKFKKDGGST